MTILHIDSSARRENSVSRGLTQKIVEHLGGDVIRRDVADGLPYVQEDWAETKGTAVDDLSTEQREIMALSDELIDELKRADTIVIGVPVYNFMIPATLKTWIDLIARAGRTFNYTADGPEGLLEGKRAILAFASGGTEIGSDMDFISPYMKFVLGFVGITDVTHVAADQLGNDAEAKIKAAEAAIAKL